MLRVEALHAIDALLADVLDDRIIIDELRMREHGQAARLMDELDDLADLKPVVRHIGWLSLLQKLGKRIAHRGEIPLLDEHAADVRAADGLARARDGQHVRLADVIAELLELFDHFGKARPARLGDIVELVNELAVVDVDVVTEDVNLLRRMMRGEL